MALDMKAYILSCPSRAELCAQTIRNLSLTDWDDEPEVVLDQTTYERSQHRQEQTSLQLLNRAAASGHEFVLFFEDDLDFNRHLRHNLERWFPLVTRRPATHLFASLYNPSVRPIHRSPLNAYFVADPLSVYGSQAYIMAAGTAGYIAANWPDIIGAQDIKMSRLAARLCPIYYHAPSLVQHVGVVSTWGGHFHSARDFDLTWTNPRG